jgi:6-phosphogluconolactonase
MRLIFSLLVTAIYWPVAAQENFMIVGTYDSPKSHGVHVFRFNSDNGTAKEISHIKSPNPSFVAVSPDERFVYAVHETAPQDGKGGEIAAFTFNKQNGTLTLLNKQLSGGDHPCHVEVDKTGKWVFASNYSSGSLSVFAVKQDGSLDTATVIRHTGSGKHPQRQKGPHVHGAIIAPGNDHLFVTDLGIDKVVNFNFNSTTGQLTPFVPAYAQSEPGSGPRLFTFHPNNKFAYVIEELSGTVSAYHYKKGHIYPVQRISTMKAGDSSYAGSADVHVSPDGKFLYASNRAKVNSIAIYRVNKKDGKLTLIGHQSELVNTPRNFSIDPSGKFLLCENQGSDEIVIFKRDEKTGLLSDSGNRVSIGKPVCIKWISVK